MTDTERDDERALPDYDGEHQEYSHLVTGFMLEDGIEALRKNLADLVADPSEETHRRAVVDVFQAMALAHRRRFAPETLNEH